jgi:hypothetical protein
MLDIKNKIDLERLVAEGIPESLTLDYKASPALSKESKARDELCKDVSALANSAGGQIIYGIEEKDQKPARVDEGNTVITREWIEQVVDSNVQPRMLGLVITPIQLEKGYGYVITVPQSTSRGAHQAPDKKYYKRQNFQSVAMEDYEIRDIMRRTSTPDLEAVITFDAGQDSIKCKVRDGMQLSETVVLHCRVRNKSSTPAHYVIVDFFIDFDLNIAFPIDPFRQVGERDEHPKMRIFRRVISSPPMTPVFLESDSAEHSAVVAVQIPFEVVASGIIYLETTVKTPGFVATDKWSIRAHEGQLTIVPPKHMRPKRQSFEEWVRG